MKLAAVLVVGLLTGQPAPPSATSVSGFASPASVLWDERSDLYLVSNLNGGALDADDNGFISRVSPPPDLRIVDLAWIDGAAADVTLHAPKGLALAGELLYVVDVGAVRMFDRTTGAPRGVVELPCAGVHDIVAAADGSGVFVSATGSIWSIEKGVARPVAAGPQLGEPRGLAITGSALVVVGFASGELYRLSGGRRTQIEKLPAGGLDGVVALPHGRFAVSSWDAAGVLIGGDGMWRKTARPVAKPADLGLDPRRGLLLVPSLDEDRVELQPVP